MLSELINAMQHIASKKKKTRGKKISPVLTTNQNQLPPLGSELQNYFSYCPPSLPSSSSYPTPTSLLLLPASSGSHVNACLISACKQA